MSLSHMGYAAFARDLNAVLSTSTSDERRTALSMLCEDGVAQVMSFSDAADDSFTRDVLCAVSPQMRLCTELFFNYTWPNDKDRSRALLDDQCGLVYCLTAGSRSQDQPSYASSLWWADRCELPLMLDVDSTRDDVLAVLPERLRGRVVALRVEVASPKDLRGSLQSPKVHVTTFLAALPTFPHVQELCIQSENNEGDFTDITEALRTAAGLPISKIVVRGFRSLRDFSALAGAQHLRSISARQCAIASMEGLASCPELTDVDVSNNPTLEGLTSLTGALRVEKLKASKCNLRSLDLLNSFTALRVVDVSENENLTSLVGLAGLLCLEKVVAHHCRLTTLHGLRNCPSLTDVDVSFNNDLSDFFDIAGAPHLMRLKVAGCDPRCLSILITLPVLAELDISYVSGVHDLRMLAGAACLEKLNAQECGLVSVEGLGQCPRLRELYVSYNKELSSLAGLAGAPLLETLNAGSCGLENVDGLNSFPKLKDVDASYNKRLTNLDGLAGAPSLEEVVVQGCSVTNTRVLDPSVRVITDEDENRVYE
ncbi:hypothetical protein N2W54_004040 [Lotmaria passim]